METVLKMFHLQSMILSLVWRTSIDRGAESALEPKEIKDDDGEAVISAIKTFGHTIHTFVERKNYKGIFLPGFQIP